MVTQSENRKRQGGEEEGKKEEEEKDKEKGEWVSVGDHEKMRENPQFLLKLKRGSKLDLQPLPPGLCSEFEDGEEMKREIEGGKKGKGEGKGKGKGREMGESRIDRQSELIGMSFPLLNFEEEGGELAFLGSKKYDDPRKVYTPSHKKEKKGEEEVEKGGIEKGGGGGGGGGGKIGETSSLAKFSFSLGKKKYKEVGGVGEEGRKEVGMREDRRSWRLEGEKDLLVLRRVGKEFYQLVNDYFGWSEPGFSDYSQVMNCFCYFILFYFIYLFIIVIFFFFLFFFFLCVCVLVIIINPNSLFSGIL